MMESLHSSVAIAASKLIASAAVFFLGEGLAGPKPVLEEVRDFVPPMDLDGFLRERLVAWMRPYQDANVSYRMMEKRIVISWAGFLDGVDGYQDYDLVYVPLDYYPTNVDILGDDVLLIAGVDDSGFTLIERFDYRWPDQSSVPIPTPSGGLRYELELPEHFRTTRAFEERTEGRHLIRFLLAIQGQPEASPPQALVQFHDSSDLWTVDSTSGKAVLLASAKVSRGKLGLVPFLNDEHLFSWKANHADYGYIYVFGFENNVEPSDPPTLVFVDGDRDGEIDNYITVPPGQWTGAWRDEERYLW